MACKLIAMISTHIYTPSSVPHHPSLAARSRSILRGGEEGLAARLHPPPLPCKLHPQAPCPTPTHPGSPTATIYTSWWRKFIAAWDIRGTFWRQIGGQHVPEKCARASYFQRRACLCLCNFHLLCQILSQRAPSVQLVVYSDTNSVAVLVSRASLSPHPLVGVARGWPARMESVICRMESGNEDKLECQHSKAEGGASSSS